MANFSQNIKPFAVIKPGEKVIDVSGFKRLEFLGADSRIFEKNKRIAGSGTCRFPGGDSQNILPSENYMNPRWACFRYGIDRFHHSEDRIKKVVLFSGKYIDFITEMKEFFMSHS